MGHIKVSLVIPVRDEEESILHLLSSIRNQTRPPDEVLFVDGGSQDRTVSLLKSSAISQGLPLRVIEAGDAYPGRGRNIGVQSSQNDIVAFTDAGVQLHPQWLERLMEPVEKDPTVDVVFGSCEPVTDSYFKKCASFIIAGTYTVIKGKRIRTFNITSIVMKKEVWRRVGGQREDLRSAEDILFIRNVLNSGLHIAYAPDALVYWDLPSDPGRTFKRFVIYSASNIKAGLASQWQYGVLRNYILAGCLLLAGIFVSPWGYLLLLTFFLIRAGKYMYQGENPPQWKMVLNIGRLITVMLIMISIDLATLLGTLKWLTDVLGAWGRKKMS